jgi:hypothetical protein
MGTKIGHHVALLGPTCQRHARQHQNYPDQHNGRDALAEDQDASTIATTGSR